MFQDFMSVVDEEHIACTFKATKLVQVGAEVLQ